MTEQEAIDLIKERCRSDDYEMNGCNLDDIILNFLSDMGLMELCEAIDSVKCWRA